MIIHEKKWIKMLQKNIVANNFPTLNTREQQWANHDFVTSLRPSCRSKMDSDKQAKGEIYALFEVLLKNMCHSYKRKMFSLKKVYS